MSLINVSNLTFAYGGGENIFENVSLQLDTDWRLGFIGRNGKGKTTFLNLLMSKYEHSGTISASVGFDYFPFGVPDKTLNTLDVIYGICADFELWELNRELSLLDVEESVLYRPFDRLSGGERTKSLLAALFLKQNNFLLIDEPTNHLDQAARKIIGDYLRSKSGFIVVSHDRTLLDACVDHVLSLNMADIEVQRGNFSSWLENKRKRDNFELAENKRLKKEIKKLTVSARQAAVWSDKVENTKRGKPGRDQGVKPDKGYIGHKAAKMMRRSKSIETRKQSAAEEKSILLKNIDKSDKLAVRPLDYHSGLLVELKGVSISYGANIVCKNVGFTINRGDRVSVEGKNGSGKSSILNLIVGGNVEYTGELKAGKNLIISHIPQETSFLSGGLREFAEGAGIDESLFKALLRKLDFSRGQFDKDIRDFSEGQKKKVLLAKSLCENAHLYVWDEPLNYIDVISRMQIESLLLEFRPTMLFVEHDAEFVSKIATKTISL